MRIGPIHINWSRRTKAGLTVYPWQALTEDRVSPELRAVVAKVARSEAKTYLEQLREESLAGCTGPHRCWPDRDPVSWCRESCPRCKGDGVMPCYAPHKSLKEHA